MLALLVSLNVKPDQRAKFLAAAEDDSTSSVRDEGGGCVRFDVLQDEADENHFYFYEVYRDQAAFDAHGTMPHYARWAAARELTVDKIERWRCNVQFPRDFK